MRAPTFTLPAQLRALAWRHQSLVYSLLFDCAVSTLKDFGLNPDKLGAELGMTAVLHTHARDKGFHPHVHIIVPGGGVNRLSGAAGRRSGAVTCSTSSLWPVCSGRVCSMA